MKKEVIDYLVDFDKYLGNNNGILYEDGDRIKRVRELIDLNACASVFKYKVDNIPAYLKYRYDTNFDYRHAYSIATSKMYNELGLINPQVFLFIECYKPNKVQYIDQPQLHKMLRV